VGPDRAIHPSRIRRHTRVVKHVQHACPCIREGPHATRSPACTAGASCLRHMWVSTHTHAYVSNGPHIYGASHVGPPRICLMWAFLSFSLSLSLSVSLSLSLSLSLALSRHTPHGPRISASLLHETPGSPSSPPLPFTLLTSHGGSSRGIWTSWRNLGRARRARRALSARAAPRRPAQSCAETPDVRCLVS
jgi:hypothetical protein